METMVDIENTFWLAALSNSVALPIAAEETTRIAISTSQTSPVKRNYSGLDLETEVSALRSGRSFFLDIPFDKAH